VVQCSSIGPTESPKLRVFVTGGAGFIGSNLAAHYLAHGHIVTLFDNLSRPRTDYNLAWLRRDANAGKMQFMRGDIRDFDQLTRAVTASQPQLIVHLASQVAVTTSIANPREDFEINALGTFNVLEAARRAPDPPVVFYASTNKVYGDMSDLGIVLDGKRYRYRDQLFGVDERQPLDFHSPYGCSKGAGDQYVRDYARIYGLCTVVFRQSCIYGERQFGVEDQGWVAHLVIAAALNRPITIYGDGKQVRDVLHITDLIRAYEMAWNRLDVANGQIFNVGGGPANTISIWEEFGPMLESLARRSLPVVFGQWRPGDQKVYISDNRKIETLLGWSPRVGVTEGIGRLWDWVMANPNMFA
jgi:CDP-paratose 2-epimerase